MGWALEAVFGMINPKAKGEIKEGEQAAAEFASKGPGSMFDISRDRAGQAKKAGE